MSFVLLPFGDLLFMKKNDKHYRVERFRKVKDITLYISLSLNILILILFIVSGCSSKPKVLDAQFHNDNNSLVNRNYANGFDFYSNEDLLTYDLLNIDPYYAPSSAISIETSINYNNMMLYNGTVEDDTIESVHFSFLDNERHDIPNAHYRIEFNDGHNNTLYYVSYEYSVNHWVLTHENQYGQVTGQVYFGINTQYFLEDIHFGVFYYMDGFFKSVSYEDLSISNNWSPYPLYRSAWRGTISDLGHYEYLTNYDYAGVMFGVKGQFYDAIRVFWSGKGSTYKINGNFTTITSDETILWVEYYNRTTHKTLTFMSLPMVAKDDGNLCYDFDSGLQVLDYQFFNVRLFDVSLNDYARGGYSNYEIFTIQSDYYDSIVGGASSGQFGDVFGLIKTAFTGLTGLLSISILPGITIGLLMFLPLVALIVFAILRVIKK